MRALSVVVVVAAFALVLASVGSSTSTGANRSSRQQAACPAAWRAGWQKLADQVGAAVYCPSWMPNPLDARIAGPWEDGYTVKPRKSFYLSFLSHDQGDVHVIFRGYVGSTRIPTCSTVDIVGGKARRGTTPCFAEPHGIDTVGAIRATLYTVNQDADQWHLLYAWHHDGSLYTVSEHVIQPFTFAQVQRNLKHMLRTLALVRPSR